MSVDQTFHTPSFGDEEFDIPPLTFAPAAAATRCSGQGVFGNHVPVEYLKRRLNGGPIYVYFPQQNGGDFRPYENHHPNQLLNHHTLQQQQINNLLDQRRSMESPQAQQYQSPPQQQSRGMSPPQDMYQNTMVSHSMNMQMQSFDGRTTYSNASSVHQNSMQPPQMSVMQQQSPPHQHMGQMGPPQQQQPMFSTVNQSQMGLQMGMGGPSPHNQNSGSMGSSPPGSNHNSPGLETSEDSDDSTPLAQLIGGMKRPSPEPVDTTTAVKANKKPKPQKKKKKRDPNEPQKPVSAYALFFRDTQAAIKGQNPNASFGEVSKIVASMWDSLDAESKNVYKKRTETAKKEYLKRLAAYRATLVSKAAVDQSDTMYGNNTMGASSPPATNSSPSHSPPGPMMSPMHKKSPVLTSVVDSMQPVTTAMSGHPSQQVVTNQQVWQMQAQQQSQMSHNSPPHVMHGNNMVNVHQQQMQMQQSPQSQMMAMNRPPGPQVSAVPPQLCTSVSNSPSYQTTISPTSAGGGHSNVTNDMMVPLQTCLRNGCSNPAIDSPDWDREYCSSECVVSHCRDVFTAWVASRQVNTVYTVK